MAAKRRASLLQREFISLIFGDEHLTASICVPVYSQLERDPGHVSRIVKDEDLMLKLLSNFELYASRVAKFFALLNQNSVNQSRQGIRRKSWVGPGIADELIEDVLFPLLGEHFEQFQMTSPFLDLFASVIDFCLPFHPRPLETLAKRLVEKESLLEALVSGENTNRAIKEWIDTFKVTIFDYKIIGGWTRRLISQCGRCESNHGVQEQTDLWQKLEDLIGHLTTIVHNYPRSKKSIQSPSPGNFRELTDSDRKSGFTNLMHQAGPELPQNVKEALQYFRIPPSNSERALVHALETLGKDETLGVLKTTVESFPCRPCYELSTSPSAVKPPDRYNVDDWGMSGPFLFTELLGHGIGIWRVVVSSQALKDLEDAYLQGDFGRAQSTLNKLASGDWLHNGLCKHVAGKTKATLYLAPYEKSRSKSGDGNESSGGILWQKDIEFDEESEATKQLVKVWRIGDLKMISQAVQQITFIHKTYLPSRVAAGNHVLIDQVSRRNLPATFHQDFDMAFGTLGAEETSDESSSETLFQFSKFHLVTQATISNLALGKTGDEYPLILSREELEIIKDATTSTLILGRSGTGKTTCLVYKMFSRYVVANNLGIERPRRQVLLTRSNVLSNKLELHTKRLLATQLNKTEPTADTADHEKPLHFTGQDDREVNDTVFSIKEEDFPLICTFNTFMKLLENTVRASNRRDFSLTERQYQNRTHDKWDPSVGSRRKWQRLFRRPQVVDFEVFSGEYWPHFSSKLTKNISVTLAFMEIIGVIKGSACRSVKFCPLSRDEYRENGYKISPVSVDRDELYNLYQQYEYQKKGFGDVDDIDRARSVIETISSNPELKRRIELAFDEIYVDEIQDQRLLEIMMLLHLIKRPNAIHFAGDTAQSISKDSVFRFNSVKDLLYERFSSSSAATPQLRGLYKNYRTHQGILSVATSVMRQLYGCFPLLVDALPEEVGQFFGPKPTVFVGFDETIFSSRMFGAADLDDAAQFGAEQVIIVRDFAQKRRLKEAIGDFALILTIMESKGMEFEDVLLYDFFATSECISAFRVIANMPIFANFDSTRHIALCSELKQLYVAITRAQSRLWFFEENKENLAPMMSIWTASETLIEVAHISDENIQEKLARLRPGTNASLEIWSTKGYEFIHKKDYENALFCFGRAKDSKGKTLANAFIAEKKGKALLASGDEDQSVEYFRKAIELFHKCEHPLREAACYETIGMFEKAADIFSHNGEFGRAGDLYNKLDHYKKASWNYSHAQRYNEGASTLARGNLFDDLVRYLYRYGFRLDPTYRLHYSRLCNLLLKRGKISPELNDLTIAAFQSDIEKEEFFLEYEMTSHLSKFYIERGKYTEACSLAMKQGDLDRAWDVYKEYGDMVQLPKQTKVELFNYAQAKQLLSSLATEPEQVFASGASWSTECPELSSSPSVTEFWENIKQVVEDLWKHKVSYKSIKFSSTLMKQIFDLLVVFKVHAFISSAEVIQQLPVESINELLRMTKQMIAVGPIPPSLLIFLRVFTTGQDVKSYTILESSSLLTEQDSPPTDSIRAIKQWMLIQDTLGIISVFCHFTPLYHMRPEELGPDGVLKMFQPRRRKWLERLVARLTYISSIESESNIIVNVGQEIARMNSPHFGVLGALQGLLFYRFKVPWDEQSDFSSMLEQLQVADTLGVPDIFRPFLARRVYSYRASEKSQNSWNAIRHIEESLRVGVNWYSVKKLNEVIQAVGCNELYSYHAVASLYERVATFLIYKSHPKDILLPNGWVNMYLQHMAHIFTTKGHNTPQVSKVVYQEALLLLIRSFCDLIIKLNNDTQFYHKLSGRQRLWSPGYLIFVRRNVDFLATCISNTLSWHTSQRIQGPGDRALHQKYLEARALVSQVLAMRFAYSPELLECSSDYSLVRKFVCSFDGYAGKDSARLVISSRDAVSFFQFLGLATPPTIYLEDLHSPESSEPQPVPDETTSSSDLDTGNYIQTVLPAVEAIQCMWRARYKVIQHRREFFKGPDGQAILYMQRICKTVAEGESLDRRERIWRRGVLFSDGLDVYISVKMIEKLYLEKRKEIKARIDSADSSQMESFQYQWERVYAIRDRVSETASFLSEINWHELNIPSQDLVEKCQEVLKALKSIESDLHTVDATERELAAAEAIQAMWRTRYPIIQARRRFSKTPSGQAISYMRRIYKTVSEDASLDRKEQIQRAAVLFTEGVNIYQQVKVVEKLYSRVKNTVRTRISCAYPTEGAQAQWEKVSQIRQQVCGSAGFLSESKWKRPNISSGELRRRCMETLVLLSYIKADLNHVINDDRRDFG